MFFRVCLFVSLVVSLVFSLLTGMNLSPAFAQYAKPNLTASKTISKKIPKEKIGEKYTYVKPSFENLSKLYWAIGKLDVSNKTAIDNYLLINECDLYRQNYYNDIEWEQIREAAKNLLSENISDFPVRFEAVRTIYLGRYDAKTEEFDLQEGSVMNGFRRLDLRVNSNKDICSHGGEIEDYPRNIILLFSRPLNLQKIPVKRDVAVKYLNDSMARYERLPEKIRLKQYERTAYLRMKIRITRYKETVLQDAVSLRAIVFAVVEGIEVYTDQNRKVLLFAKDSEYQKRRTVNHYDKNGKKIK